MSEGLTEIRQKILDNPGSVLNDREVMRALIQAGDEAINPNVIDLRSVAIKKLEQRLDNLEGHNNSIISAAYDNIATTDLFHRAILALLTPNSFSEFLDYLRGDWAESLRCTVARLCLEAPRVDLDDMPVLQREFGPGVVFLQKDEVDFYITLGREEETPRPITLRQVNRGVSKIHGEYADDIRSEALLKIDLGNGSRPGLIVLSSDKPEQFEPNHATDLLVFYGSVFERVIQRWLTEDLG